jgi:hypothetical protein
MIGLPPVCGEGVTQMVPQCSKNHRSGHIHLVDAHKDGGEGFRIFGQRSGPPVWTFPHAHWGGLGKCMSTSRSHICISQTTIAPRRTFQARPRILKVSCMIGLPPVCWEGMTQMVPQCSKNHRSGHIHPVDAQKHGGEGCRIFGPRPFPLRWVG